MNDLNQQARDGSSNLIATELSSVFELGASPPGGYGLEVHVPIDPTGTNPTLDVTVEAAESEAGTYAVIATMRQITDVTGRDIDADGTREGLATYFMRFASHLSHYRVRQTVGGTTPNFGAVIVNINNKGNRNVLTQGAATVALP